jgi:Lambda phage tail tube protein, TTP
MAVTGAITGTGVIFSIGNGSGGGSITYTDVGEVTNIKHPSITREAIDATHLASPDKFREFIAGMLDTEPATISLNYVPSAADPLYAAILAGAGDFRITHPNGVKMDFMGIPTNFAPGDVSNDKMQGEFVVKGSGKPIFS